MADNHRIVGDGNDWMRNVERRMGRQERRPEPTSFLNQLGVGISQRARHIIDWNDPQTLRNGWYYSDILSLNTPDPDIAWIGQVIITFDGHGVQQLWSHTHDAIPVGYVRQFHFHEGAVLPTFTDWGQTAGPMGGLWAPLAVSQSAASGVWTTITGWSAASHLGVPNQVVEYVGGGGFLIKRDGWYTIRTQISLGVGTVGTSRYVGLRVDGGSIAENSIVAGAWIIGASVEWEGALLESNVVSVGVWHDSGGPLSTWAYTYNVEPRSFISIRQVSY